MVSRRRSAMVAMVAVAMLLGSTGEASARPVKRPVASGGTDSGAGDTTTKDVGKCYVYANSGRFGPTYGTNNGNTVQKILHGDPLPDCWDEIIPDTKLSAYGYTPGTQPYFIHSCLTGKVDPYATPRHQPDMQINQKIIPIPTNKNCDAPPPFHETSSGQCIEWLTDPEKGLFTAPLGGTIPSIVMVDHPTTKVRTNQPTAYQDVAFDFAQAQVIQRRTADYVAGGVTMWAEMDHYYIYPYGKDDHTDAKECDGTMTLDATATSTSAPGACWYTYPSSSHGQPGESYPFRAEADWTVYYDDGAGKTFLASFQKFDDVTVPVFDVQTAVVG